MQIKRGSRFLKIVELTRNFRNTFHHSMHILQYPDNRHPHSTQRPHFHLRNPVSMTSSIERSNSSIDTSCLEFI